MTNFVVENNELIFYEVVSIGLTRTSLWSPPLSAALVITGLSIKGLASDWRQTISCTNTDLLSISPLWLNSRKSGSTYKTFLKVILGMPPNWWLFCSGLNGVSLTVGIILCMHPANEGWRYTVTPSLISWVHTQNGPCKELIADCFIAINCMMWIRFPVPGPPIRQLGN